MGFRPIFGPRCPRCRNFEANVSSEGADVSPILNPPNLQGCGRCRCPTDTSLKTCPALKALLEAALPSNSTVHVQLRHPVKHAFDMEGIPSTESERIHPVHTYTTDLYQDLHVILMPIPSVSFAMVFHKYEGRTESHEQLFFACELGTADE